MLKEAYFIGVSCTLGQFSLGERYTKLKRCVSINLLNFDLSSENNRYHRMLSVLDVDTHEVLAPELEIHYLIIPQNAERYL